MIQKRSVGICFFLNSDSAEVVTLKWRKLNSGVVYRLSLSYFNICSVINFLDAVNYLEQVLMKELGMDEFLTVLREEYLQPLVDVAFPHIGQCDSHRAFTVKYNADGTVQAGDGDKYLGLHYDNAEVTINVCLQADNCKGSDLMFLGIADVSLGYVIFTLHSSQADIKKKNHGTLKFWDGFSKNVYQKI